MELQSELAPLGTRELESCRRKYNGEYDADLQEVLGVPEEQFNLKTSS